MTHYSTLSFSSSIDVLTCQQSDVSNNRTQLSASCLSLRSLSKTVRPKQPVALLELLRMVEWSPPLTI